MCGELIGDGVVMYKLPKYIGSFFEVLLFAELSRFKSCLLRQNYVRLCVQTPF